MAELLAAEVDDLLSLIDEARKRIGVRKWRRMKRMVTLRAKSPPKPKHVRKIHRPWRSGAAHNRHR